MKQVIIEVEKWYAFGNHFNPNVPENKLQYLDRARLYVPNIGQCCLGFVCQALGAPLEKIKGITMPSSIPCLHKYPEIQNSWMVEKNHADNLELASELDSVNDDSWMVEKNHADNSELANELARVNDAPEHYDDFYCIFTIEEKMGFLITALLEQGMDLQFV